MDALYKGLVVKSTGKWYKVRKEEGEVYNCRILGRFRLQGQDITNPVTVGDVVLFRLENDEEKGIIEKIFPRKNYIARQSPRRLHQVQLLGSNVDQAVLMVTLNSPSLKPGFIDRFLLMTEPQDIPVILLFNKYDLFTNKDRETFEYLKRVYGDIGYTVLACSALESYNVERLRDLLKSKTSLIGGQSGVGKSSLVNALQPNIDIKTNLLSKRSGKGQHTTTFAQMVHIDEDIQLIDTPGIKTLSFNNLEPHDIAHNFREIFDHSSECKYNNCLHREEPRCAVREKIENGAISELRYFNYVHILEEIERQNYWERKTRY